MKFLMNPLAVLLMVFLLIISKIRDAIEAKRLYKKAMIPLLLFLIVPTMIISFFIFVCTEVKKSLFKK